MKRSVIIVGLVVIVGVTAAVAMLPKSANAPPPPVTVSGEPQQAVTTVADGLEIPWETAFLPDGRILVTERPGRVRLIGDGRLQPEPVLSVQTTGSGEGGLQGMALDPQFTQNGYVYLYLSRGSGNALINRVDRYRFDGSRLIEPRTLLDNIPGNNNHNGGRLAFGPDGKLYVTTGDSQEPSLAQDRNSLAGKILRLNSDGSMPADNPFGNLVWSYGHRNPQGIGWDKDGVMYQAEHGPSGDLGLQARDEINRIEKGANYGWPLVTADQTRDGLTAPLLQSGEETWAPAGLAVGRDGKIYVANLRGAFLMVVTIEGGKVTDTEQRFDGAYGRLRAVTVGPDGALYLTTSNRDGRGNVNQGDDKLIRVRL